MSTYVNKLNRGGSRVWQSLVHQTILCCLPRASGLALATVWLGVMAMETMAGALPSQLNLSGVRLAVCARGSSQVVATGKIDRVYLNHRKVGFFSFRLLPILVVQGPRIELIDAKSAGDWWMDAMQSQLTQRQGRIPVEWRDVELRFQPTNSLCICAAAAQLTSGGGPVLCRFDNVTIQADGEKWAIQKAELRTEQGGRLVGKRPNGPDFVWDIVSGKRLD